jgi:hypothetical protein
MRTTRHSTVSDSDTYLGYATVDLGDWALTVTGLKREWIAPYSNPTTAACN